MPSETRYNFAFVCIVAAFIKDVSVVYKVSRLSHKIDHFSDPSTYWFHVCTDFSIKKRHLDASRTICVHWFTSVGKYHVIGVIHDIYVVVTHVFGRGYQFIS